MRYQLRKDDIYYKIVDTLKNEDTMWDDDIEAVFNCSLSNQVGNYHSEVIIAKADTLEELKQKVPYLFL